MLALAVLAINLKAVAVMANEAVSTIEEWDTSFSLETNAFFSLLDADADADADAASDEAPQLTRAQTKASEKGKASKKNKASKKGKATSPPSVSPTASPTSTPSVSPTASPTSTQVNSTTLAMDVRRRVQVERARMAIKLELQTSSNIAHAISQIGRTEDVKFSPDERRLAIAGLGTNRVVLIDIELKHAIGASAGPRVVVTGFTELRSPCLAQPHGLAFIDDDHIVVANREGSVQVFRLPIPAPGIHRLEVEPVQVLVGTEDVEGFMSPGSVAVVRTAPDVHELIVCNNYSNRVTRWLIDSRSHRTLSGEVLLTAGLNIPDGVAVSDDHRWIAISNHDTHEVLLFDQSSNGSKAAVGSLGNVNRPHGLRFVLGDELVLLADAAMPCVHVFARGKDDWRGSREPVAVVRVMDDETYLRGVVDEGGPKGLDVAQVGRVVVVTSEHQPLAFFDLSAFVDEPEGQQDDAAPPRPAKGWRPVDLHTH